ncbi:MAG: GGDEF domain-containing protein [Candidatus Eremiobacteraeota bacterium]|nr:GGDEF domain-containing protein [Candidatus Eremiobacteraeota bacterium]MBV9647276.1 GGDEF domain-containing protein [Candidatus Eremiobacteraeota bacterium]
MNTTLPQERGLRSPFDERAKWHSASAIGAALVGIVFLGILDLLSSNLHVGALVAIPLIVLAYYVRPWIAFLVGVAIAPVFSALDHDWFAVMPPSSLSVPLDALILAVAFAAVVLTVARMRQRDMQHAKLSADYAHMRVLAERDRLTDLPNRAVFFDGLSQLLGVAAREGDRHGVLFFDLDGFKAVNDTYGHAAGDRVLLMVGTRLRSLLRDFGVAARIGGDEFAAVVEHVRDRNDLERVAYRIEQTLTKPFALGRFDVTLGVSVGSALFPDDATDADSLLAQADVAMYRAKRAKYRTAD